MVSWGWTGMEVDEVLKGKAGRSPRRRKHWEPGWIWKPWPGNGFNLQFHSLLFQHVSFIILLDMPAPDFSPPCCSLDFLSFFACTSLVSLPPISLCQPSFFLAAARVTFLTNQSDHMTPWLKSVQWLPWLLGRNEAPFFGTRGSGELKNDHRCPLPCMRALLQSDFAALPVERRRPFLHLFSLDLDVWPLLFFSGTFGSPWGQAQASGLVDDRPHGESIQSP